MAVLGEEGYASYFCWHGYKQRKYTRNTSDKSNLQYQAEKREEPATDGNMRFWWIYIHLQGFYPGSGFHKPAAAIHLT